MPKGVYERTKELATDEEFLLGLLKRSELAMAVSEICDRLYRRMPDRRAVYDLLRDMERDGKIARVHPERRGQWYIAGENSV